MNTDTIVATLLAAAAFLKQAIQEAATETVKDLFDAARYYLRKKFGGGSDGATVLELAVEKPESAMRKAVLAEELTTAGLATDPELQRIIEQLARLLPVASEQLDQNVQVTGDRNQVQVAGRDIVVHAAKHVRRVMITPDERHVTSDQRQRLREVIGEVAARIGDTAPNYAAVHRMLTRRFNVVSYLLLGRDQFDAALSFLKQQREMRRSRLRHRDPTAYNRDFFRAIFSMADELGWERRALYDFATEKLGLKTPITSLRQLGTNQLKPLTACLRQQARQSRAHAV